jgi:2-keto-3-deoxy-L-rhamnonate aldolase RhmA
MLETRDYNAMSLAQPTNFKSMLASGEYLWGTGCRIAHPEAARILATTPYHFCFIDAVSLALLSPAVQQSKKITQSYYRNTLP